MAVVTKYGSGYKDPAALRPIDAIFAEGVERKLTSLVPIANGDSATSVVYLGRIPSNALISAGSLIYADALAGVTSFSLGFANAAAALMNAVNISAGGSFSAFSAVTISNYTKRAWQLAGLSSDPGGMLDVFGTLNTASTAAGNIVLSMPYVKTA